MPNQEDIAHQQELLVAYRRTLAQYLKQQALISELFTPPAIAHGIDDARANIRRVKSTLQVWGIPIEDLPDDQAPPAAPPVSVAKPLNSLRPIRSRRIVFLVVGLLVLGGATGLAALLISRMRAPASGLSSYFAWSQCDVAPAWILPGTILPAQDPNTAREQLAQAIATKQIDTWPVAGPDVVALISGAQQSQPRKLYMTISGTGSGKVDIHLFSQADVTVTPQELPAHVDVATIRATNILDIPAGCGGGTNRTFLPTELTSELRQYIEERTYTDYPFLTLSSESSEVLAFPFQCRSPGAYTIQIALRYRDNVRATSATYAGSERPTIVCPSSFTFWPVTYARGDPGSNKPSVQLGIPKQYYWDGMRYQEGAKPSD
jgi:hypothetical protein